MFYFIVISLIFNTVLANSDMLREGKYLLKDEPISSYQSLKISNVRKRAFNFELLGENIVRGHSCVLGFNWDKADLNAKDATLQLQKNGVWKYVDFEENGCEVSFKVVSGEKVKVDIIGCRAFCGIGAGLENGVYELSTCKDFVRDKIRIGNLSLKKKTREALDLGIETKKNCKRELSAFQLSSLYSDLAFLYFKAGEKLKCLAHVNDGMKVLGVSSLKEAEKDIKDSGGEKENGRWSCNGNIYCVNDKEKLKIYDQLAHNRKLCQD